MGETITSDAGRAHRWGARRISEEPVINWLHAHALSIATVLLGAGLLHASLLPLEFEWGRFPTDWAGVWRWLWRPYLNLGDVLVNLALYVPLGFVGYLAGRRVGAGPAAALAGPVAGAFLLSVTCEVIQIALPQRFPSVVDVACNTLGAALGAISGWALRPALRVVANDLRRSIRRQPWLAGAKVFAGLLVAVHLRPYDAVLNVREVARAAASARIDPTHEWRTLAHARRMGGRGTRSLSDLEARRARWDYALDRVAEAAGYAVLAGLVAWGMYIHLGCGRWAAMGYAVFVCAANCGVVTALETLMRSRGFDSAHLLCGLAGGALGSALMATRMRGTSPARDRALGKGTGPEAPRWVTWGAAGAAVAFCVARGLAPFEFDVANASRTMDRRMNWLPLAMHFGSRPTEVFYDISGKALEGLVLGVLLWGAAARMGGMWRTKVLGVTAGAALLSMAMQAAHLFQAVRRFDVTTVLLAAFGAAAGAVGVRWARDYFAALGVRRFDDLLTTQLIEGGAHPPRGTQKKGAIEARRI